MKNALFDHPTGPRSNLIIIDQLINPPTLFGSFRDLSLFCRVFLNLYVLIESEDPDPYFRWLRERGGMDFVSDFVRPDTESGIFIDVDYNRSPTVVTDRIVPENLNRILSEIKMVHSLR